jgi:hypothetical protein
MFQRVAMANGQGWRKFVEMVDQAMPISGTNLLLPPAEGKNVHAQALSALGASKGGKARAANLTAKKRKEIAAKAAKARWSRKVP